MTDSASTEYRPSKLIALYHGTIVESAAAITTCGIDRTFFASTSPHVAATYAAYRSSYDGAEAAIVAVFVPSMLLRWLQRVGHAYMTSLPGGREQVVFRKDAWPHLNLCEFATWTVRGRFESEDSHVARRRREPAAAPA